MLEGQTLSIPRVSAVICTRDRSDKVGTAVSSVLANDYPTFDLTVIDQSRDGLTREVLEPLAAIDPRLKYVLVDEAGLSRAYNHGVRRTDGEILAFTDDDCIVGTDWISTIVAAFAAEPDGELLYGRVVAAGGSDDDLFLTPSLDIPVAERLAVGEGFKVFGMGANFAARRRLFARTGLFDEILGGGGALWSSQDFDLEYRAYRAGAVILLRPDVSLRHDGRREAEDWPKLLLAYGAGDGAFYMKHVRCWDAYAMWLLARRFVGTSARFVAKTALLRKDDNRFYLRGLARGARASFKFGVDRRTRLYVGR